MSFLIFVIAMGVLIWGADVLIHQSEKIALRFDIPEFIIGATLIALGTSLPEMAASVAASMGNKPDIAISNVIEQYPQYYTCTCCGLPHRQRCRTRSRLFRQRQYLGTHACICLCPDDHG